MRTFIIRSAIFSALVLTLFGIAEVYIEIAPNPYRDKHEWMKAHAAEVETLILGSSHTYYGVCPEDLGGGAFSLANPSQTYRYDEYLLHHYDMPGLRCVILPFSYFSLWEDLEAQGLVNYVAAYRIYMDCDIHSRLSRYGLEILYLPALREKLKAMVRPRRMMWSERGWGMEYTLDRRAKDWDNGEERAKRNTYTDTTLVKENWLRLCRIADWCRGRGVRLLIVQPPVRASFVAHTSNSQNQTNADCLEALKGMYPEIVVLDLERDVRFGPADFYDSDHLNRDGAHKLSGILREYTWSASVP